MASPISTGGDGTHFESRVGAYYLATVLSQGAVRGLPMGNSATRIAAQRKFEGEPLDDVIVFGTNIASQSKLSLQVKRTITIGDNELFNSVIDECWKTFSAQTFNANSEKFGIAVATPIPLVEAAGKEVLKWVRYSADSTDFFTRLNTKKLASDKMQRFVESIRQAINKSAGSVVPNDQLWKFLTHFVVLYFDLSHAEQSHHKTDVIERLKFALHPSDREKAGDLWRTLIDVADELKPTAGSIDRAWLINRLAPEFQLAHQLNIAADMDILRDVGARALEDIRSEIGGVHLPRLPLENQLREAMAETFCIEIMGEAGSGKSAIAKGVISQLADEGPVLVLSAKRLPSDISGWEGLAAHWGIKASLKNIISELSCASTPALFIDGIERISSPGAWLAVNDMLRAIKDHPGYARWRVLITARENSLRYRKQLDEHVTEGNFSVVVVGELSEDEIEDVALHFPHISPLVSKDGRANKLATRPFLLDRLIRFGTPSTSSPGPLSEIDLMLQLWTWSGTGSDIDEAAILERQNTLVEIGRNSLATSRRETSSIGLSNQGLISLEQDGIIHVDIETRQFQFTHDILEDWALCQALYHDRRSLNEILEQSDQPLWLINAVQLLAQWRLERTDNSNEWSKLISSASHAPLEPRWRRAVLAAPLQSTKSYSLINRVSDVLWESDGSLLKELFIAMRTIEVDPNPYVLDKRIYPDWDDDTRIQIANSWALPRIRSWRTFFSWLVKQLPALPANFVEATSLVLETLITPDQFIPDWAAPSIAEWAQTWLDYITPKDFRSDFEEKRERWSELDIKYENEAKLTDRLILILLRCVSGAPDKVAQYMSSTTEGRMRRGEVSYIIENANYLVEGIPEQLCDFMLVALISDPFDDRFNDRFDTWNKLGIEHDNKFFPSSHLRPPFLKLLRTSPNQGIRLVNGLSNHSMEVWRDLYKRTQEGTPLPVTIQFPWGARTFWGHAREYTWNRGIGPGPYPVMSSLMALEVWMEEEVDKGRDLEGLFKQVLEGNDCVGALGACVAISLKYPEKSLRAAIPLASHPQLYQWEFHRMINDGRSNSNRIGSPKDRPFLTQVIERNDMPYRRTVLRDLYGYYLFSADDEIKASFSEAVRSISEEDIPFEFAEQTTNDEIRQDTLDRIKQMKAVADVSNWRAGRIPDSDNIYIQYDAPLEIAPSTEEQKEFQMIQELMSGAMWAEKTLDGNSVNEALTLEEAYEMALRYEDKALATRLPSHDDGHKRYQLAFVMGTAAVILIHGKEEDGSFAWARKQISMAAALPIEDNGYLFDRSIMSFYPPKYAATALTHLVQSGRANQEDIETILFLVCHPIFEVKTNVFKGLQNCWSLAPHLCWNAFALGVQLSIMPTDILKERRGNPGIGVTEKQARWMEGLLVKTVENTNKKVFSQLPSVSPQWIKAKEGATGTLNGYVKSEDALMWHELPIALPHLPLGDVMSHPDTRQPLINLARDLMNWTILDAAPPWDKNRRSSMSFEWGQSFMEWCASVSEHLSETETQEIIVGPIASIAEDDNGEYLLNNLMTSLLLKQFDQEEKPSDKLMSLWRKLVNVIFAHKDAVWHGRKDAMVTMGYGECVSLVVFSCYGLTILRHPWPGLESVKDIIREWVGLFSFAPPYYACLIEFLDEAGWPWLSTHGIDWIEAVVDEYPNDQTFWNKSDSGTKTATIIQKLLTKQENNVCPDPALHRRLLKITDILVQNGIRLAAQVQQQLAAIKEK